MRPGRYPTSHPLEQRARQQLRDKTAADTKQPGYGNADTPLISANQHRRQLGLNPRPDKPRRWT